VYFLCVPPAAAQSPKSAVAWTFSQKEENYHPLIIT
jgi:hypothetical protein